MFSKEKLDQRVGRIPSGYAAYEAEAVELYPIEDTSSTVELGNVSLAATVEVDIAS